MEQDLISIVVPVYRAEYPMRVKTGIRRMRPVLGYLTK